MSVRSRPFAVWAPNADEVTLLLFDPEAGAGDEPVSTSAMVRDDGGTWTVAADAPPGTQYLFRLRRGDEQFDRIDPSAREVTSSVGRAVVTAAFDEWTDEGFAPRPLNEWVIYELHPGTFAGTLDDAAKRLDLLVELGVTAVELMPVAEFAGDVSWGYNPALPYAVESSYGGPAALDRFVDAAHARGIAVVLDVVYNHLGPSDLDLWRFDGWYEGDSGGIWFYDDWRAETPWGATRPDYGRDEVRGFLVDNARAWLAEHHLDGLRLDSTVNIRNAHGGPGPDGDLDDGWRFLCELTSTIRREYPAAVLIAEDLQGDPRVTTPVDDGGLGFHLQWSAGFVHPIRAALEAIDDAHRDVDAVAAALAGGPEGSARVVYTESHDEVANGRTRVPAEIDATDPDSLHAWRRAALGAVLVIAGAGVPMLFQGQEWADEDWFDDTEDLRWERRDERAGSVAMWRDLIRLRTGDDDRAPGLRGDRIECTTTGPDGSVLVVRRWGIGGEEAATLVVANLSAHDIDDVVLPAGGATAWECVFASDWSGYHHSGTDSVRPRADAVVAVPAYGAAIYVPAVA